MKAHLSYERAINKMKALANVLQRPLRDVLDSGARVAAISCAKSTQPDGTGNDSKEEGEKAVARDIYTVYGSAHKVFEAIGDPRQRRAFWSQYKAGNYDRAEDIARASGVRVGGFDGGSAHQAVRRARRPRVPRTTKPFVYIINPEEREKLNKYIEKQKEDVGTVKGGWADVVRALGGTPRGLRTEGDITANWITRKGRGYGKFFRGGTDQNPTIIIENRVPNAEQAFSQSARKYAASVARSRMLENLEHAVKAEAKNLRSAA